MKGDEEDGEFVSMKVEVCRKCGHWVEFVSLMENHGVALLACGCTKFHIVQDIATNEGRKYDKVAKAMRRHGRKKCATFAGKAFPKIVGESLNADYERMMRKVPRSNVPKGCPYHVEHMMTEWNRQDDGI